MSGSITTSILIVCSENKMLIVIRESHECMCTTGASCVTSPRALSAGHQAAAARCRYCMILFWQLNKCAQKHLHVARSSSSSVESALGPALPFTRFKFCFCRKE